MFTYNESLRDATVIIRQPSLLNSTKHRMRTFSNRRVLWSARRKRIWAGHSTGLPYRQLWVYTNNSRKARRLSEMKQMFCANISYNHRESIVLGSASHDSGKIPPEILHWLKFNFNFNVLVRIRKYFCNLQSFGVSDFDAWLRHICFSWCQSTCRPQKGVLLQDNGEVAMKKPPRISRCRELKWSILPAAAFLDPPR